MTAKTTLALIWEWYECEKSKAFWDFFFPFMGYTKHIHAALAFSWVVVSSKPHQTFVLPSSIFLESELKLSSMLHTVCYYVETVLTSPHGINFNRCCQIFKNQNPRLLSSLGMVWVKRLDVHKSNKPQTQDTLPSLKTHLKSFLTHMLYPKTISGANTGMALNPPARAHPCAAPKTTHTTYFFPPEDDEGDPRAGVLPWSWPS